MVFELDYVTLFLYRLGIEGSRRHVLKLLQDHCHSNCHYHYIVQHHRQGTNAPIVSAVSKGSPSVSLGTQLKTHSEHQIIQVVKITVI